MHPPPSASTREVPALLSPWRAAPALPARPCPVPGTDRGDDHHLWRNGNLWWIVLTVYGPLGRRRVRRSLETADVALARARRDRILDRLRASTRWVLAARQGVTMRRLA